MKKNIGYLPNFNQTRDNILEILEFFKQENSLNSFARFFALKYGSKSESTIRLTINTLINYGLLTETDDYIFRVSSIGANWIKNPDSMELIKIIDRHVEFISDLMHELSDSSHTAEELIAIAEHKYDVCIGGSDFSRRCQVLKSMNLIKMNRRKQYSLTPEGIKFLETLKNGNGTEKSVPAQREGKTVERIPPAKHIHANDDTKFRKITKRIMEFLVAAKSKSYIYQGGVMLRELYGMLDTFYPSDYENMESDTQEALRLLTAPGIEAVVCNGEGRYQAVKSWNEAEKRIEFYSNLLEKWRKG